jgi:hypothetical protein
MESKVCTKCGNKKDLCDFHKDKAKKDGYRNICKNCSHNYIQNYYSVNEDKVKEKNKIWRNNNQKSIIERNEKWKEANSEKYKEIQIKYRKEKKEKIQKRNNIYNKKRKSIDPVYKLRCGITRTISDTLRLKKLTKKSRTCAILGCSFEDFRNYLELLWEHTNNLNENACVWMTWDNYGKYNGTRNFGWDIDHIEPISKAKTEDDVIRLSHYTNLQPLCSKINRDIKKDKTIF